MRQQKTAAADSARGLNKAALVKAVDSISATRGCGVLLRQHGRMETLRPSRGGDAQILFELRERYVDPRFLQRVSQTNGPFTTAGARQAGWSLMRVDAQSRSSPSAAPPHQTAHSPAQRPISRLPNRRSTTIPMGEWQSLGLNCAGAAIGWIGVVGTGALAPVTAGTSALATAALYAGALAGSGQCLASVYRVNNARRGRSDMNDELDRSPAYKWTMLTADGIGLFGAYGAFKAAGAGARALRATGVSLGDVSARAIGVAERRQLALALGLNSGRVGTRVIDRVVRQRLLDTAGAVLGVYGSIDGGIVHELVVWIIAEERRLS